MPPNLIGTDDKHLCFPVKPPQFLSIRAQLRKVKIFAGKRFGQAAGKIDVGRHIVDHFRL